MLEVIPDLLSGDQLAAIRASIDDGGFVDGRKTAGARAARVKRNEQLGARAPGKKSVQAKILSALEDDRAFRRFALPAKINQPLISRYRKGMAYGLHVDNAMMDKGAIRAKLAKDAPGAEETDRAHRAHANLFRMWAES